MYNKIALCGLKADFSLAKELTDADPLLGSTDALILASACGCEGCNILYTTDRVMTTSIKIAEKVGDDIEIKPLE